MFFVALKLAVKRRIVATVVVALRLPMHTREKIALEETLWARHEREHEAKDPALARDRSALPASGQLAAIRLRGCRPRSLEEPHPTSR